MVWPARIGSRRGDETHHRGATVHELRPGSEKVGALGGLEGESLEGVLEGESAPAAAAHSGSTPVAVDEVSVASFLSGFVFGGSSPHGLARLRGPEGGLPTISLGPALAATVKEQVDGWRSRWRDG